MQNIKLKKTKGFTLIEILVVMAIIGILLGVIAPKIIGRSDDAKLVKAKQDIVTLEGALDVYRLDNGDYPSTEQGLDALVNAPSIEPVPSNYKHGGYIKKLPKDPWGNSYQYLYPGVHAEMDVYSYGPKGRVASADDKNMIGNWG
jgi:general secretion pathway protein G